jgi:hypothetical protein
MQCRARPIAANPNAGRNPFLHQKTQGNRHPAAVLWRLRLEGRRAVLYGLGPSMARDEKPIRWKTLLVLLAVALGLGSWYRLPELAKKPMHLDEAVLAIKTQEYWKTGTFEYDLRDYHGPFLHHLTKWVGSLRGWSADTVTEQELRWVIAVCGLLLVLTPLLFIERGWRPCFSRCHP